MSRLLTASTKSRVFFCCGLFATAIWAETARADLPAKPKNHWSFQALPSREQLLTKLAPSSRDAQPIDRYIRRQLEAGGLSPAPRAKPHRQLRRLSLMLTGLPPDPGIAKAFASDPSEEHYAALVDRYLQSPQFGERWARHWMDVVRYAETLGYEWNHLIREAWRYRDYLIRAFNQDLPYDQLIAEHLAGDLLDHPRTNEKLGINESLIGTSFYRFGETGHDDCLLYPDISLDVLDNQIDTLSKAFQALTVSCARCHDHKLDDIPQRDYYTLLGIMASSRQVIRTLDLPHRQDALKNQLADLKPKIRAELAGIWKRECKGLTLQGLEQAVGPPGSESKKPSAADRLEHPLYVFGRMMSRPDDTSWEEEWRAARETMRAEHEQRVSHNREHYELFGDFTDKAASRADWGIEGLGFQDEEGFLAHGDFSVLPSGPQVIHGLLRAGLYSHGLSQKLNGVLRSPLLPENRKFVSYEAMGMQNSVRRTVIANCTLPYFHTHRYSSPNLSWQSVNLEQLRNTPLRPLRSYLEWATVLDDQGYPILDLPRAKYRETLANPRSWFGITKVYLHNVGGTPRQELQARLQVFKSTPTDADELANLYRGILSAAIDRWSAGQAGEEDVFWLNAFLDLGVLSRETKASAALSKIVADYRALEEKLATPMRIAGMADQDDGFDVPLLGGGEIGQPGELVPRSYLSQIEKLLPEQPARQGSGRRRLAEMIAHPENPLTARVMANRVWHYLLGNGIVRSVDDFGRLGDAPSHPELLDYLARRFVDSGWSVKSLVREIALSDTFRQSVALSAEGTEIDPENRLFHRYSSRRLEAEAIRDSILWSSGRLDPAMFGPSVNPYRPGDIDRRKLYAGPLDGNGRRSIYLMVTRMGPSKILELFNFPDPSATRGRRDATNVPSQALGLLNHPFVHQQAEVHAERLLVAGGADATFEALLERLFLRLFSRPPSAAERTEYAEFFRELSTARGVASEEEALRNKELWKDLIHTLYNLKEFSYVL